MLKTVWFTLSFLVLSASSTFAFQELPYRPEVQQEERNSRALLPSPKNTSRVRPVSTAKLKTAHAFKTEPRFSSDDLSWVSGTERLRFFGYVGGWYEVRNGGGYRRGWIHENWIDAGSIILCSGRPTVTLCRTIPERTFLSDSHQGY